MATNMTEMTAGQRLEALRLHRLESEPERTARASAETLTAAIRRPAADPAPEEPRNRTASGVDGPEFALLPLVDRIAYAFASGLIVAMRELEAHIAGETQKVNDSVNRHLGSLQASLQELSEALSEQRSLNVAVQEKCRELEAATVSLQQTDERQDGELQTLRAEATALSASLAERFELAGASLRDSEARQNGEITALREEARQTASALSEKIDGTAATLREADNRIAADISSLRSETRDVAASITERVEMLVKELMLQQDDLAAVKTSVTGFCTTIDGFSERLDRQAEALRSMFAAYSQRETQLEQLVDGLTRLRTFSAPAPATGQL